MYKEGNRRVNKMSSKIITLDEFSDKEVKEAGKELEGFKETEVGLIPEDLDVERVVSTLWK
jgi:hypothetical protein